MQMRNVIIATAANGHQCGYYPIKNLKSHGLSTINNNNAIRICRKWTGKMAQLGRVLAAKPDHLSLIPKMHKMEGKN